MPKPYPAEFRDDVVRVARDREPGVVATRDQPLFVGFITRMARREFPLLILCGIPIRVSFGQEALPIEVSTTAIYVRTLYPRVDTIQGAARRVNPAVMGSQAVAANPTIKMRAENKMPKIPTTSRKVLANRTIPG